MLLGMALGGVATVLIGVEMRGRLNPPTVEWGGARFRIERREEAEHVRFDFVPAGGTAAALSLHGTTDTLCDEPWLMRFDVDGDGREDVYFHHCGGHGFVKHEGALELVNLGQVDPRDAPRLEGAMFREIRSGAVDLISVGILACMAGAAGAVFAWRRRSGVRRPTRGDHLLP